MTVSKVYFVSGIDTDIGKTVATGLLARSFAARGVRVITQKLVQTGCVGISEDIIRHRQIMGLDLLPEDKTGVTCPYVFRVPCSPHLAAKLEGKRIEPAVLQQCTAQLMEQFDIVFVEGAGGLAVPLVDDFTLLDYLEQQQYPLILVTSSRLGSINHTLTALELARNRKIDVAQLFYNREAAADPRITEDSRMVFVRYMEKYSFSGKVIDLFPLEDYQNSERNYDFAKYFPA